MYLLRSTTASSIKIISTVPYVGAAFGFLAGYIFSTLPDGAYTSVFAAINPVVRAEPEKYKGKYLVPMGRIAAPASAAEDLELAKQLWALSEKVVADDGIA